MASSLLVVVGFIGVLSLNPIHTTEAKHMTNHHLDIPEEAVNLNERFFNDVRALIKRRLKENVAIKKLHMESETNTFDKEETPVVTAQETIDNNIAHVATPVLVENWPINSHSNRFGQVTAVSVDPEGNPVIFHRADRYWGANTFNDSNIYYLIEYGPISEKTIYVLDPKSGAIKSGWGEDLFYMPHGMTIDVHGNYWITDVAMHQAFKFKLGEKKPQIVIGKRFRPGSSVKHLCKPTSIAVSTTGEFFVADGYCNQRILKFNAAGRLLRTIPQPPGERMEYVEIMKHAFPLERFHCKVIYW